MDDDVQTLSGEENETETKEKQDEKAISSDLIRGHINTIILRSLYDEDRYGYDIIAEIERKSHGQYTLKQPSLYSALKRLEAQGYVTSYWGGSVGGGRRKYFSLTEEGKAISEQNQSEWEYSRTVIDSLISDKDFDFSNPAPTAVNMRVLRNSTSRVPTRNADGEEEDYPDYTFEPSFAESEERDRFLQEQARAEADLQAQRTALEEERARLAEEKTRLEEQLQSQGALEEEKTRLEEEKARLEEQLQAQTEALEEERRRAEEALKEHEETLREEREQQAAIFAEQERALEAERARVEEMQSAQSSSQLAAEQEEQLKERELQFERERSLRSEELLARERELDEEREHYRNLLAERERQLNEEREQHAKELEEREKLLQAEQDKLYQERDLHARELEEQEQRILAEQEQLFQQRERQLIHQNYLNLVNTPPAPPASEQSDYSYFTAPVAEETPDKEQSSESLLYNAKPESEREYRAIIEKLYANAVRPPETQAEQRGAVAEAPAPEPRREQAQSLGRFDFYDLETRAAQDGIKITTSGGLKKEKDDPSESIIHKGKALFLSALVVFVICLAEGSIVLAMTEKLAIPLFEPYFIWGTGLALLLVTGLAYANRYGENAIRRPGLLTLFNAIVIYALLVIADLIIALAARINFADAGQLASAVLIPIVYFLNVVFFAVVYYFQTRPKKD